MSVNLTYVTDRRIGPGSTIDYGYWWSVLFQSKYRFSGPIILIGHARWLLVTAS